MNVNTLPELLDDWQTRSIPRAGDAIYNSRPNTAQGMSGMIRVR